MRRISLAIVTLTVATCAADRASAAPNFIPPVDAPISVRFVEPAHRFAPGHRGVDYDVDPGTPVRAAASGTVRFAGPVAGDLAVTIAHELGFETTYTAMSDIAVTRGQAVSQGEWIGHALRSHPGGGAGLHFGVKFQSAYVDPETLFGHFDVSEAIHLAPLVWQPPRAMPDAFRTAFADAGASQRPCRTAPPLQGTTDFAPNENVAVAIAGMGSSTRDGISADMYEHGPEELGYSADRTYRFSYAGPTGPGLHRPYESTDTFGDIGEAARRLRDTLVRVARRHPGQRVDLIAHSMGGLVARRFLNEFSDEPGLPQIEHLVTFATPHRGSSLAKLPASLETKTLTGGLLLDGASAWAQHGGPLPDPRSTAVGQLSPDSAFLDDLAREGVAFGTRVLALGTANDLVVTADRARWDQARSRTIGPAGLMGHSAIVAADDAQGLAYAFLRDASPSCETGWDIWGPRIGRATGFVEENSYRGLAAAEEATLGRVLRVGRVVDRFVDGRLGRVARKVAGKIVHRTAVRVLRRPR